MEFEYYLIEEKYYIIAINEISKNINSILQDMFYKIIKGNVKKSDIEKIIALNISICCLTYSLRQRRLDYYKTIDENYIDNFTYNEMV